MPITVKIDGYLVQEKPEAALKQIVGEVAWHGREQPVARGKRMRWDMVLSGPSGKVAVEFDGDKHYRHSLKIKADREKDACARDGGYQIVLGPTHNNDRETLLRYRSQYHPGLSARVHHHKGISGIVLSDGHRSISPGT